MKHKAQLIMHCAVALVFCTLFVTGCASKGTLQVQDSPSVKLSSYEGISVRVTSDVSGAETEIALLESFIIAQLRSSTIFDKVYSAVAGSTRASDLRLSATITQLRRVSAGERMMVGAFAGRGKVVVRIELHDDKTGKVIGRATAEGITSGGTAFAGTTPQAIERVAEQVVKFILDTPNGDGS